jgi:SAM-dependent methyltransferase
VTKRGRESLPGAGLKPGPTIRPDVGPGNPGVGPGFSPATSDHYSYTAYADAEMAAGFDAKRFGGPIGRLLLADQERVLTASLGDLSKQRILDVGTGTGRAALALARRGARVAGIDASTEMLSVARRRAAEAGLPIEFTEADAHSLPFPDRSFDSVVCLRLLMHVPDWRRSVFELCRVADKRIVFDYPSLASAASLQALWRRVALAGGRNVEAYRTFRDGAIARELARHGFRITATHKQYVLPIAIHKLIGSAGFTRAIEGTLAGIGVLRLAGSPVTIAAERCAS